MIKPPAIDPVQGKVLVNAEGDRHGVMHAEARQALREPVPADEGGVVATFTADAATVDRALDVSSPTAANVAQVLNALLGDLSREFVVVRK